MSAVRDTTHPPGCRCHQAKGRRLGCEVCGPQPRTAMVACRYCRSLTFNVVPVCDLCAETLEAIAGQLDAVAS